MSQGQYADVNDLPRYDETHGMTDYNIDSPLCPATVLAFLDQK